MLYIVWNLYKEIRILKKNNFVESRELGFFELSADPIMASGMCSSFPRPGLPDRALWQSLYL